MVQQSFLIDPGTSAEDQARQRMAYGMLQQGMQGGPVGHWTEGAGRLAKALVGGYHMRGMREEGKKERGEANKLLSEVLGIGGSPAPQTSSAAPWRSSQPARPEIEAGTGAAARPQGGSVVDNIIMAESGGNPTAKNPRSSAYGSGQFIDATWLDMVRRHKPELAQGQSNEELLAMRADPALSREITGLYAQDNGQILQKYGFEATPGNVYLAHFAGPGGATRLLRADPSAPVSQVLGQQAVEANPFLANMNVGDVRAWADRKGGGAGGQAPQQPQANLDAPRSVQTQTIDPYTGNAMQPGAQPSAQPAGQPGMQPQAGQSSPTSPRSPFGIDQQTAQVIQKLSGNRLTAPLAMKLLEAAMTPQNKVGRYRPSKQGVVDTVTGQIVPGTEQAAGDAEYGTSPQYYQDAEGNVRVSQLSKGGGRKDVDLPEGAQWLPGIQFQDVGTGVIPLNKRTAQPTGPMIPKDVAGESGQRELGKSQTQARQALPAAETTMQNAFATIKSLRTHPGLDTGTGASSVFDPRSWIPGSDSYDFQVKNRQAMGQSFMTAREALKGAGQVTDFEGKKGEEAIASLETAQSKEQYLEMLDTLEKMMQASYNDLRTKAGLDPMKTDAGGVVKWERGPDGKPRRVQ